EGSLAVAAALAIAAPFVLRRMSTGTWLAPLMLTLSAAALATGFGADLYSWWGAGLRPEASGQGATVFGLLSLQGFMVAVVVLMAGYGIARSWAGHLSARRTSTVDLIALFMSYTAVQGGLGAAVVRLFPGGG